MTLFYVVGGARRAVRHRPRARLLCAQKIRGRSFFRVVFFMPLMVTPVGIAYTFRMLADTTIGPFAPFWQLFGLGDFAWATEPVVGPPGRHDRRHLAVDPVHLHRAARRAREPAARQVEAAELDGARRWQIFRDITWPAIAPVAATVC